ncbi:MAG: glycosyltransferase 87 family protein [Actinomycetota bacterium]|nr:glycosyltransferase 87 family protein [Actinomycetota bacterium]
MLNIKFLGRTVAEYFRLLAFGFGLVIYVLYFQSRVNQSDFQVLYSSADAVIHHISPYPAVGSPSVYSGSSFVYPYAVAYLFVPFTWLSPSQAQYTFVLVSVASVGLALWLLGVRRLSAYVLFLAASTTIVAWQMGTLNPLFVLGLATAWRFRSKAFVIGAVVSSVAFAKLFLLPLLVWLIITRRFRALAYALAFLAVLAAVSFLGGPLSFGHYLTLLGQLSRHEGARGFSTSFVVRSFGLSQNLSEIISFSIACLLMGFIYWRYRATESEALVLAGMIGISLVITPILWSSYLLLVTVVLLLIFSTEVAAILYALLSWVIVTPDRAGIMAVASLLIVVMFVSIALLGWSPLRPAFMNEIRGHLERFAPKPKLVAAVLVPILIFGATAVFDFRIQPAIAVQLLLLYLLPLAILVLTRKRPQAACQSE